MQHLQELIAAVPDFPKPGILFRDIAPLLRQRFSATIDALEAMLSTAEWHGIDAVAGVESRGFILAAALADRRGKGFVPVRKQGKLPPPVVAAAYALEYGQAVLEMQMGSGRLLLVDDVLATGGTLTAAAAVSRLAGFDVVEAIALIDIGIAPGYTCAGRPVRSVLQYG